MGGGVDDDEAMGAVVSSRSRSPASALPGFSDVVMDAMLLSSIMLEDGAAGLAACARFPSDGGGGRSGAGGRGASCVRSDAI